MADPPLIPPGEERPIDRLLSPMYAFLRIEAAGGILLLACTAVALAWANGWPEHYHHLWHDTVLSVGIEGRFAIRHSLGHWVNDGLMAIFFLVVGLEIKRELLVGELASPRRAALPIAAAIGGMAAPAIIYGAVNAGGVGARGWAIPCATDIAFALGVLALLGKRVPLPLKVFLTALAIVDDLGAVVIIAVYYTGGLSWTALAVAAAVTAVLIALNRLQVRRLSVYMVLGAVLWAAVLQSGVHATIAGVVLAFTIPAKLRRLEHMLHPWSSYLIMPIFALANAGVLLRGDVGGMLANRVSLGVMLGLVAGKQAGVALSCLLAVKLGLADLPAGVSWRQVYGASWLAGIGFTMSLFVGGLAFGDGALLDAAKAGVLAGSLVSGTVGYLLLRAARRSRSDP